MDPLIGLRGIVVQQPFAWAMFHADPVKDVENRTWTLNVSHVDTRLVIVAAKGHWEWDENYGACAAICPTPGRNDERLVYGAILGTVLYKGFTCNSKSPWAVRDWRFLAHWQLADPQPLQTPLLYRGGQGLLEIKKENFLESHI